MNEQLWTTFKMVAEVGSLSQASRSLNLSQSAVTQHIHQLEQYYQCSLFVRTSQGVHLTEAGEILYRYVNDLLHIAHESREAIIRSRNSRPQSLSIGASFTIAEYFLPEILPQYCKIHSQCSVSVMMANSRAVFEQVLHKQCDVGLIESTLHHHQIAVQPFFSDCLQVIVGKNHAWFDREHISLEEFAQEPLFIREPGSGTRSALEEALKIVNMDIQQLNVRLVLATTQAIKSMVKQGFGISVLSPLVITPEEDSVFHQLEIKGLTILRNFSIITHHDALPSHINPFIHLVLESSSRINARLYGLKRS
ncbi:LysR family transcriptional regulator [Sulfobacillus thermosulfidooxidans]|uniref:LysR family transcriptional regulator n=1 Tax=Sulfobacillus thermosulfidooxidans TaxID=28034 RepID=UPI00096BAD69|nr:LysR family transcriptional regulator [Sulfobacillus thermosulfidooxidans]OLZ09640.1 LysR family transcriptional regulator [Sulfobacillus thermosulfidooxidans]OLZ16054.1 LysR family transcriptional regulator [Sulfobacillus thermosulfidooxidans]OLZ18098.1 LysR family transcriptional regulator [Sulfobacillus thermosulfidooxidans]